MEKVRSNYSDEFINELTEEFLATMASHENVERVREEIKNLRQKNYDAFFLEMYCAVITVQNKDAVEAVSRLMDVAELDEAAIVLHSAESILAGKIIDYLDKKPSEIAKKGGDGRAKKLKILEAETIRLYKLGSWESLPIAAAEITPKIIEFSKKGHGDLVPSTTKPLAWIRAYVYPKK